MPLVRQRHEGLCQNLDMRCGHTKLPLVSPFDAPSGANDVPSIHQTFQISVGQLKPSVAVLSETCLQSSFTQLSEEGSDGTTVIG